MKSKKKRWAGRVAPIGRRKICMMGCCSKWKLLGGLGVEGSIILKWILMKYD
jgi:hypothetical protein